MSTQVDERVVSMQFDNKQFESNVQTSLSTLDKLKRSLNMDGASKGLENVNTAANNVNMSGLSGAVETVRTKFSALEVMGVTALANITNSAVNAGKNIVSALTIDPIKTGFQEYETQINAVQTILANTESKGSTLKDVNGALDELNTYADKTIYNFTEMTRNIGTFTAAGVDLDTSVSAIKGIANLAAVSGSNSQQASTAMYQLSQALASGTVKLQDWNSVVNAGMGGQVFQDSLKETARVHGVSIDDMIKKEGSFRESLKNGWLTSEILTETLNKFTGDLNEKQLKSMGYTDKQIEGIIKMGKTANDAATKVKTFTQLFDTLKEAVQSGWTSSWEIIVGDFEEAKVLLTEISDVFGKMIGDSANARNEMLQGWKDLGGRTELIDAIRNAFEGIMDIIKPIKEAFREIFPPVTGEQLYNLTNGLLKLTEKFKISETMADNLKRTFKGVFALFDIGVQIIKSLFGGFVDLVKYISPAGNGILGFTANVGDFIVSIDNAVKSSNIFKKIIQGIGNFLKPIVEGIKEFAKSITDTFDEITNKAEIRFEPLAALGEFIKKIFVGIANIISKVAPWIAKFANGVGNVFSGLMDKISTSIQNSDYNSIFDILNGGIISAIGIYIAKFIKSAKELTDNAGGFLGSIKDILGGVGDALNSFSKSIKAKTLKTIAISIGILAASLLVLSFIDSEKLTSSLAAISALFAELMITMKVFTETVDGKKFDNIGKVSRAMFGLSAALLVLAVAMKIMSTMSWQEMGVGLISITVGLGVLIGAVHLLPEKDVNKAAKAIKKLSTSLLIFAVAMKIISSMSWQEMGIGLTTTIVGLGALVGAVNLLPKENVYKSAKAITKLSFSLLIFAAAMKIMGSMSWQEMGIGLITTVVGLSAMVAAANLLPKDLAFKAIGMVAFATSMVIIASALKIMGSMSWQEMSIGLVALTGSLAAMAIAVNVMKKSFFGAAALLIVSEAIAILAIDLKILGSMQWDEIIRGLTALAGVFTIVGLAGLILKPLVPTILALSASILLFGIGCTAVGAGVLMFAAGLAALSVALSASGGAIVIFVSSIIGLIPYLIEQIGVGIIKLCEVIAGSAEAICKAVTVIILAVVDALVASVPAIVEGLFVLIEELLKSLVNHTPTIVVAIFDFLIGIINACAEKLPELIKAGVNLLMAFFSGVIDALKGIDYGVLMKGLTAVGLLSAIVVALAAVAALTPLAMVGVLGLGAVATELAVVLAAIGGLAQIPGLEWLVTEGGNFLQKIGTAIGKFLGGIIGGVAKGITSALPQIGTDLSEFMKEIKPFIDGAKSIDEGTLNGVKSLVDVILALTAANILEGLTSWITGGSSLTKFGEEIAAFAPNLKSYADAVSGIDGSAVVASANAAKALSEMAKNLPNSGGLAGFFAGENDIGSFGEQLVTFGNGMKSYSDSIVDFDPEAVIASANAAKSLSEMASTIPNEGGLVAWFTGENSVSKFSDDLVKLGTGLSSFSDSIIGFDPEAATAAANAAKSIAEMASTIPNEGGMVTWFTGDNSIASFADQLPILGDGLYDFSESVIGIVPENIIAAANAAKSIAEMASIIPNEGGIVAWFTGDNSVASFASQLPILGEGLSSFSTSVDGINSENIISASKAAKSLAEMANIIPNEGGMVAWFTGDNSVASFASQLPILGAGLLWFSNSVEGVNSENLTSAANAAKTLAEMSNTIPNQGGISAWFTGENSITTFASQLPTLGKGLKGFSDELEGFSPENVTSAANVAKTIAEITSIVPNQGGITAWFTGESNISTFADQLPTLGKGLKGFSDSLVDFKPGNVDTAVSAVKSLSEITNILPNQGGVIAWFTGETNISTFADQLPTLGKGLKEFSNELDGFSPENVTAATTAAKTLAEITNIIPKEGGIVAWFTGETSITNFADRLPTLGKGLKDFSDSLDGLKPEYVTSAASAAKSLAEMVSNTPENTSKIVPFGENLVAFGGSLKSYFDKIKDVTSDNIKMSSEAYKAVNNLSNNFDVSKAMNAAKAIKTVSESINEMSKINEGSVDRFNEAVEKLGKSNIDSLLKAFKDAESKLKDAGQSLIKKFIEGVDSKKDSTNISAKTIADKFVDGIESKQKKVNETCKTFVDGGIEAIRDKYSGFYTAGSYLVTGFCNGISENDYKAEAKAEAMAKAAKKAAEKTLDINSPSKVFYGIGKYTGQGFVNALDDYSSIAYDSASNVGYSARNGLSWAISKIGDIINGDIDIQPTIRPVIDLSDVKSGVNTIGGMLSGRRTLSIDTRSVGIISESMSQIQNGNGTDEIVSSIKELRKDIANTPRNVYTINGVTYDDGSNISSAVKTIVRAARIERRT